MPNETQTVTEGASVQVTPAQPANDPTAAPAAPTTPQEDQPAVKPSVIQKLVSLLTGLLIVSLVACTPSSPVTAPAHQDGLGMGDDAHIVAVARPAGLPSHVPFIHLGSEAPEPTQYRVQLQVAKCWGEVAACGADQAYEIVQAEQNLLTTAGAQALWNGLSTAGLATPFNTTNAQLAVGDGTTAAAVGDTDLSAATGTTVAISGATNATPIVLTTAAQSWVVGQVITVSGVVGNTAANGTWEISAVTGTTATLLNSAGNGAYTSGGTAGLRNYYRQQANGTGSAAVSTNQIQYVATFGTANANFAWQEWGLTTGAAATNKQATPPPTLFNHKIASLGTKTSAASWTLTTTLSLS